VRAQSLRRAPTATHSGSAPALPRAKNQQYGRGTALALHAGMFSAFMESGPDGALSQPLEDPIVLEATGITKVYRMGEIDVQALRGVDIALHSGELVVLLGASGSGKSTLLNILGGLDTPSAGTVRYRDHDLTHAGERELTLYRRHHVGFVFQFYNLIPSLTARENVALVTEIADSPLEPEVALELVGLAARQDHFPAQLSGGEQQRVAIARAIAKRPDVLLCDEPTGALDYQTGVLVLDVIDRINRELGTTTAVITHNAPVAALADRVLTLQDGRLASNVRNRQRCSAHELRW
jgi:putative ABC transport system ATP-binding protein